VEWLPKKSEVAIAFMIRFIIGTSRFSGGDIVRRRRSGQPNIYIKDRVCLDLPFALDVKGGE